MYKPFKPHVLDFCYKYRMQN